jgi:glutamine synthetase adenylyltransferase
VPPSKTGYELAQSLQQVLSQQQAKAGVPEDVRQRAMGVLKGTNPEGGTDATIAATLVLAQAQGAQSLAALKKQRDALGEPIPEVGAHSLRRAALDYAVLMRRVRELKKRARFQVLVCHLGAATSMYEKSLMSSSLAAAYGQKAQYAILEGIETAHRTVQEEKGLVTTTARMTRDLML